MTETIKTPTIPVVAVTISSHTAPAEIKAKGSRRGVWLSALLLLGALGAAGYYFWGEALLSRLKKTTTLIPENAGLKATGVIPVNTCRPVRKTLVRQVEQAGSIQPQAQAEIYAKVSGYLKFIQRDPGAACASQIVLIRMTGLLSGAGESPAGLLLNPLPLLQQHWQQSPQKDIGSVVHAGDVIVMLDVPEYRSDVAQKQAVLHQRDAELEQARALLHTYEAGIDAAESKQKSALAEFHRSQAECEFRQGELYRLQALVKDRTVTEEVVSEKLNQVNATKAACEAAQAKVDAEKAEYSVATSKLIAARADLLVKQALVDVAREDLQHARVWAEYAILRAPFDGIITERTVDEGDFIQNASTGQSRPLMTVTALDRVRMTLQVPEKEANLIHLGAQATIQMDARERWEGTGRVSRVSGVLESQTRTMRVELDLENRDHKLKPGMYGHVTVLLEKMENAMAIPATAVFNRRGENYIVLARQGVAKRIPVRLRFDDGEELEVAQMVDGKEVPLSGLEDLVVSNKGEIGDGQRIKATPLGKVGR
jgi:HlyD family secretion protein